MRPAFTVGAAVALTECSNLPKTEPRRRLHDDGEEEYLPPSGKCQFIHRPSVQGELGLETSSPLKTNTRCRSRSVSDENSITHSPSADDEGHKKAAHEPTPTPTPSPSPTAIARKSEQTPPTVFSSIFLSLPAFPPADFDPCCQHLHLKNTVLDEDILLPPELLVALIFGPSEAFDSFERRQNASQVQYPPWEPAIPKPDVAMMQRGELPAQLGFTSAKTGSYRLQLGWPVGPRYADLIEKHTIFPETRPGVFYLMERETIAPKMPFGDSFLTVWRYCIRRLPARFPDDKIVRSHLTLTGEVQYKKKIWQTFKMAIEHNARSAIESFLGVLRVAIAEESRKYTASAIAAGIATTTPDDATTSLPQTPSVRQIASSGTLRPRNNATSQAAAPSTITAATFQRRVAPSYQIAPPVEDTIMPQINGGASSIPVLGRVDQWLVSHPQLAVRTLLFAVIILLVLTFFLAKRISEIEEHLLRYGLPSHSSCRQYQATALNFQNSPEIGPIFRQLGQAAGQLSDSLTTLGDTIRNQQANGRPTASSSV